MLYNTLLEKCILPLGDRCLGKKFMRSLRAIRRYDSYSEEEVAALQREKLRAVIEHAIEKSPFYRERAEGLDLASLATDPFAFLRSLPTLEKADIRAHTADMLTQQDNLVERKSSGSSGHQTTVYFSKDELSLQQAYQIRWWEWAGFKMGMPILQTGMTSRRGFVKSVKDFLLRTYYLEAFALSDGDMQQAFAWARRHKSVFMGGYASSLYVLSSYLHERGERVPFTGVISWGDKLFSHYAESIASACETSVYETYASTEGFLVAAQKDLPYMYLMAPHVYIEIVDDEGREVPDGALGHVLVTSLDAYAMPLLRYRVGDLAIKLPREEYPAERELPYPLLQRVIGRDTDLVKTHSGKYMVVHTFTGIFEHYESIKQFCVIQRDMDGIEILYIPEETFQPEVLEEIRAQLLSYLKEWNFVITFTAVDHIKPTASGKPQIIKSLLNPKI